MEKQVMSFVVEVEAQFCDMCIFWFTGKAKGTWKSGKVLSKLNTNARKKSLRFLFV